MNKEEIDKKGFTARLHESPYYSSPVKGWLALEEGMNDDNGCFSLTPELAKAGGEVEFSQGVDVVKEWEISIDKIELEELSAPLAYYFDLEVKIVE